MALTISLTGDWMESLGSKRATSGTITFDSAYAAGGESLTAANVGLGVIDFLELNQGEDGYVFHWDKANNKIVVYQQTDPADAGGADIPLVEASGDLSAVVVNFRAIGY